MTKRTQKIESGDDGWLGYQFRNPVLLQQALTHTSVSKASDSYERLEFLGDRVLGLIIAEALFRQHGREREGKLSARHSSLVKGEVCGDIALALGLSERMHVGVVERKQGLQNTRPILGDVMEAVIGAIYLDGGFDAAQAFIQKHWADFLADPASAAKDAKTFVQEWALARGKFLPVYEVIGREGPEHRPEFTVRLLLGRHGGAEGKGPTKQAAEMVAAHQFIVTGALR